MYWLLGTMKMLFVIDCDIEKILRSKDLFFSSANAESVLMCWESMYFNSSI